MTLSTSQALSGPQFSHKSNGMIAATFPNPQGQPNPDCEALWTCIALWGRRLGVWRGCFICHCSENVAAQGNDSLVPREHTALWTQSSPVLTPAVLSFLCNSAASQHSWSVGGCWLPLPPPAMGLMARAGGGEKEGQQGPHHWGKQ